MLAFESASRLLGVPWSGDPLPVALVDLAAEGATWRDVHLPPFPVIGIGPDAHALAPHMDVLLSSDGEARAIVASCTRFPRASAVLVQLLRMIAGLPLADALVAESMAYGLLQGSAEHAAWLAGRQGEAAPATASGRLRLEREGNELVLTIDRSESRNAIDRTLRDALREGFEIAALDPEVTRVVLRAQGRVFSTGADLSEFGTTRDPALAHAIRMQTLPAHAIAACADRLEVEVQGACIGSGLEMAAFARRIVAREDAWFHLPELAMGLMPGAGGCVSLSRRIGRARTAQMVLSGRRINARTALAWGLIDAIA